MREWKDGMMNPGQLDPDHPLQCSMGWVSYVQTLWPCTAACGMGDARRRCGWVRVINPGWGEGGWDVHLGL